MFQRAGWDRRENGTYSEVLLYADLEYIDYRQCLHEVPQVFRHYVTFDKFCAGFIDGKVSTYFKFLFISLIQDLSLIHISFHVQSDTKYKTKLSHPLLINITITENQYSNNCTANIRVCNVQQ